MNQKIRRNRYLVVRTAGVLCLLLACTLLLSQRSYAATEKIKLNGKCGPHATWKVNKKSKTLIISGKGSITKRIPLREVEEDGEFLVGNSNVERIVIQEGITAIACHRPFLYVRAAKSIKLPTTLKSIAETGLAGISYLETVTIPQHVKEIGDGAFYSNTKLKSIRVHQKNPHFCSVDGILFSKDKKTLVAYPKGKLSADKKYIVPDEVTKIAPLAFAENRNLKKIVLPKTLEELGGGAFFDCSSLEEINLQDTKVSELPDYDGRETHLANDWMMQDDDSWFWEDVIYPDEYCWLGTFGHTSLEALFLPDKVKKISTYCILYNDITSLRLGAEYNGKINTNFQEGFLVYPDVLLLDELDNLRTIEVDAENPVYMAKDNVIYSKDGSIVYGCASGNSVQEITLDSNAKRIMPYAFYNNWNLKSVSSNHSLISIGKQAFGESPADVSVAGDIGYIESYAFSDGSISHFSVTGNLFFLGSYAFNGCKALKDFKVEGQVYEVQEYAFEGSAVVDLPVGRLQKLSGNSADKSSGSCGSDVTWKLDTEKKKVIISGSGMITEKITLPYEVARNIKHIQIKNGITGIAVCSPFTSLSYVEKITLPQSLTYIASFAFKDLTYLKELTIPEKVSYIGDGVFYNCIRLRELIVAKKNKKYITIDGGIFTKSKNKIVAFPMRPKKISHYTVPKKVRKIAPLAFAGSRIYKMILPEKLTHIGGGAFYKSMIQSINLQDTKVTQLPDYNGWEIQMPNPVYGSDKDLSKEDYYYWGTFEGTWIKELELPPRVKKISSRCLLDSYIQTLTLGEKYKGSIGAELTAEMFTDEAAQLGVYNKCLIPTAFPKLIALHVNPKNENYMIEDGVIYDKSGSTAYGLNYTYTDTIILKDTVTAIAPFAFYKMECLQRVVVPAALETIGTGAFMDSGLWEFQMQGAVRVIGDFAFQNTKITTFINDGVNQVGKSAFRHTYLTTVALGDNVASMGEFAFANCYILKDVSFRGTAVISENTFYNCVSLINSSFPVTTDVVSLGGISKGI